MKEQTQDEVIPYLLSSIDVIAGDSTTTCSVELAGRLIGSFGCPNAASGGGGGGGEIGSRHALHVLTRHGSRRSGTSLNMESGTNT